MRVLNTVTGQFAQIDPGRPKDSQSIPTKYAIMSHVWAKGGEQSYQELRVIQKQYPPSDSHGQTPSPIWADTKLSLKTRQACRVVREKGYCYLWADWCCIDQSSSSEVSESINSMYQWYALADVCYAYLPDVPTEKDYTAEDSAFRKSCWFTRGWTLQELIAPLNVVFLAKDWTVIGSKISLGDTIAEITKIDYDALLCIEPLKTFSVAQRFSWAADRETTKVEDRAYSLLGILELNMPTLYGEGDQAFRRLQEEIMRRTPDQTLFAWTACGLQQSLSNTLPYNPETCDSTKYTKQPLTLHDDDSLSLLAPSLEYFSRCERIRKLSHDEVLSRLQLTAEDLPVTNYDFTPYGIHVKLPVISFDTSKYFAPGLLVPTDLSTECPAFFQWYLVILGCEHGDFPGCLLGRVCYIQSSGPSVDLVYSGYINHGKVDGHKLSDLLPVSPDTIERLQARDNSTPAPHISSRMLYIPQPPRRDEAANFRGRDRPHQAINLVLPKKVRDALSDQGYTTTLIRPDDAPTTHSVTLTHDTHIISIEYQHTLSTPSIGCTDQTLAIKACVTTCTRKTSGVRRGLEKPDSTQRQAVVSCQWDDWFKNRWAESLQLQSLSLTTPQSTLSLGLAFFTTNHYLLSIKLDFSRSDTSLEVALRRHQ